MRDAAINRLFWVVAYDRQQQDGRTRVTPFHIEGTRLLFDEPLSVREDEYITFEYEEATDLPARGWAFAVKAPL